MRLNDIHKALIISLLLFTFSYTIVIELNSTSPYLASLSFVLLFFMVGFNLISIRNLVNPLLFFSVMYSGYIVGGYYYSQSEGYFGKFLYFLDIGKEQAEWYLVLSLIYSIICFFFLSLGYYINGLHNKADFQLNVSTFDTFLGRYYKYISYSFIFIGLVYWIWVSNTIAGGVVDSLILFQVFPHLAKQHNISIAPYLLYYSGIYIWLIGISVTNDKFSKRFVLFSLIGFVICISTARISMSVTYILVQLVFVYLIRPSSRKKISLVAVALLSSAFVLHLLREVSNHYFLHGSVEGFNLNVLRTIIGGGNVSDLQQIAIVFYSFDLNNALVGSSYIDWFRNFVGVYLGMEPSSIGLLIHEKYIPSTSGAPTPGAIGEAFANFNLGAPLFMFLVGYVFSYIHFISLKSSSAIVLFVYASFLVCFVFLYPKVDSTMIVNLIWGILPTICCILIYYVLFLIAGTKSNIKKT